jgi:CRP-like cAMP-binding protein
LQVIYEYDPLPLRRRFEDTHAQRYLWLQRRLGSEHWEVSVRKLPASANGSIADFMNRCPLFAAANESTRSTLALAAQPRSVPRKTIIAEQEAGWPFLGVVRKGKVFAIVGTPAGREQILFEALETDVFGVILDGGSTFSRFATLSDAADILLFPKPFVLQLAEADPRFALALAASVSQQMRTIVDLVHAHVSKKTIARVASTLVPYAPSESGLAPVDPVHLPSLRLTQIAAATGSVKEVVARAVAELEAARAIRRVRGRIAYIDRSKITSFAL